MGYAICDKWQHCNNAAMQQCNKISDKRYGICDMGYAICDKQYAISDKQ